MLSDEEKQAMESLIEIREFANLSNYKDTKISQLNALDIVLNLIEKQSKEIEELKEDNKHQWEERCKLTFELENSTSNDKIKAKIEAIKTNKLRYFHIAPENWAINILQSLLEKE